MKARVTEGVTPRNPELSIYDGLQEFVRYMKDERQASPYTLDAYERDLLRFATALEHSDKHTLASITSEDVRAHMRELLDRHLAKASVRRAMYAIGSWFRWAVRWELVPTNPVLRVTVPPRERVRDVRALSTRERAVLIAAADRLAVGSRRVLDAQAPLLVRLMLKTGLRRGEVLGLAWRDLNLDRGELLVRFGKGKKSRGVPVADRDLLQRLGRLQRERGIDETTAGALVFINGRGTRLAHSSFYRLFHRILAAAELRGTGITPHALRHTFGSVLCARGVPVPYVKELLGHQDIGSTMIYVHSTPAALRAAVQKLKD